MGRSLLPVGQFAPTTFRTGQHGERAAREAVAAIARAKALNPTPIPPPAGMVPAEAAVWCRLALELHGVIEPVDTLMLGELVTRIVLARKVFADCAKLEPGSLEHSRAMRAMVQADRMAQRLARQFFLDGALKLDVRAFAKAWAKSGRG